MAKDTLLLNCLWMGYVSPREGIYFLELILDVFHKHPKLIMLTWEYSMRYPRAHNSVRLLTEAILNKLRVEGCSLSHLQGYIYKYDI